MTRFFAGFAVAYVLAAVYWAFLLGAAGTDKTTGARLSAREIAAISALWPATFGIAFYRNGLLAAALTPEAADANR